MAWQDVTNVLSSWTWSSAFITLLLLLNLKNHPLMWHFRFVRALLTVLQRKDDRLTPECIFPLIITSTRAPISECGCNIHKSNSTYHMDLDMSRGRLRLLLFREKLSVFPGRDATMVILSGSSIVFKPWDEKMAISGVAFRRKGLYKPTRYHFQPFECQPASALKPNKSFTGGAETKNTKGVYASAISRYVFKQGRKTVPPAKMLYGCGLLYLEHEGARKDLRQTLAKSSSGGSCGLTDLASGVDALLGLSESASITKHEGVGLLGEKEGNDNMAKEVERRRIDNLPIVQRLAGWDVVHALFECDPQIALGRYPDMLWP
ncbi:hypothetical protein B0O99DRAFT_656604 [Bisporella sp. PMI_857]|nr:hypothetical protein B0O99DRAFT_656604 [Bisporella sp. PMI_857]